MPRKSFDVALSFAGEQRDIALLLKTACETQGLKVFYDDDKKWDLWGKDLFDRLTQVYFKEARYCVILVSKEYAEKHWTRVERRAAQSAAFLQDEEYILPIKIDRTELDGLLPTTGYVTWADETPETVARGLAIKMRRKQSKERLQVLPRTPIVRGQTAKPSIDSFQVRLGELYQTVNRPLPAEYFFGYLTRTIGYLSKKVAQGAADGEDFIRPISWLCALASKLGVNLQEAFITRFPERCPSCGQPTCVCSRTGKKPPNDISAYKVKDDLEWRRIEIEGSSVVLGFNYAARSLDTIFPSNEIVWNKIGSAFHFVKLQEEIAEVHEAMVAVITKKKDVSALAGEIADVLAWLVSAWHIAHPKASLDDELVNYYYGGCPVCGQPRCTCKPYLSKALNLFNPDRIRELATLLESLAIELPDERDQIVELHRSAKIVLETEDDPLARFTLFQIHTAMKRLSNKIRKTRAQKKTLSKIQSALSLAEIASRG